MIIDLEMFSPPYIYTPHSLPFSFYALIEIKEFCYKLGGSSLRSLIEGVHKTYSLIS